MKRHLSPLSSPARVALVALACGLSCHAQAAQTTASSQAAGFLTAEDRDLAAVKVQTVGDDVLAGQTGKYAGGTMISGFVLNVISQWQLPNGVAALAQGTLAAVQNTVGQVSTTVSTLASVSGSNAAANAGAGSGAGFGATPAAQVSGGQSVSVNGMSQVTQVAGDRNVGSNSALIDFNNPSAAVPLVSTANAPSGSASSSASNSTGSVKAGISFGSNGVNVALQTPAGLATQTITPGNGQIAQLLQIAGNNQQVANALQLHLQTQQMSAAMIRQLGVLQALQNRR